MSPRQSAAVQPAGRRARRIWLRAASSILLLVVTALLVIRGLGLQGLVWPVRVASGSMGPTLLGPHFRLACKDCGITWCFDAQTRSEELSRLVCPNCGFLQPQTDAPLRVWRGERVLIDRGAYRRGVPRRWDIAAYSSDGGEEDRQSGPVQYVKRIVGLPGEQIEIRNGDLFANGRVLRKSLKQFRSLAILVHDNEHQPRHSLIPPRWDAEPVGDKNQPAWISYRAWRCFDSPMPRTAETILLDNDGYNQSLSRQAQPCFDVLLECRVRCRGETEVLLRGHDGWSEYVAAIRLPAGKFTLRRDGQIVTEGVVPSNPAILDATWQFALFDQQVMLAIQGKPVFTYQHDGTPETARQAVLRPLAYSFRGANVAVDRLRILRDIHYLDPPGLGRPWESPTLADDEYFVLGDNVPISVDSRSGARAVKRRQLIGRVLPLPWR